MNPDDPRLRAVERLAITRERLRLSLRQADGPQRAAGDGPPSALVSALLSIPGARIVVDAVRDWWAQHPMHLAGLLAVNATRSVVGPMARRNPFGLALAAVAVGGLLVWLKPWRGLLKPALLAGLVPTLISRAVAHVPLESWLSALMAMTASQRAPAAGETAAAAAQPQPAQAQPQPASEPPPPRTTGDEQAPLRPPTAPLH